MIRFGRANMNETWAGCDAPAIDEAIALLRGALATTAIGRGLVLLGAGMLPPAQRGTHCRLEFRGIDEAQRNLAVHWADDALDTLGSDWIEARVRDREGRTLSAVLIRAHRAYHASECCRALESGFESALERPGRAAVIDSVRLRSDAVRPAGAGHRLGAAAAFHCENPNCSHYGRQLLMRVAPGQRRLLRRSHMAKRAYPCPFCHGELGNRWALTFDGLVCAGTGGGPARAQNARFIDMPIDTPYKRVRSRPGRMKRVTSNMSPRWGSCWDSGTVSRLTPALRDALEQARLPLLLRAACESEDAARLAAAAIDNVNLRALVDCARQLPPGEKTPQLARAMTSMITPRRLNVFNTRDDAIDEARPRHPYIALPADSFFERLRFFDLLSHRGRFIDIGCGIGDKPFLAHALGRFRCCDGLEVNQQTLAVGHFLLASLATDRPYPIRLFAGDAVCFDGYGDYDVIYMYRPISDAALYVDMIRHATAQMKPGSILLDAYFQQLAVRREECGLHRLAPDCGSTADWVGPVEIDEVLRDCGLIA